MLKIAAWVLPHLFQTTKNIEPPTLRSHLQLRQRRQEAPPIRVLTGVVVREPAAKRSRQKR